METQWLMYNSLLLFLIVLILLVLCLETISMSVCGARVCVRACAYACLLANTHACIMVHAYMHVCACACAYACMRVCLQMLTWDVAYCCKQMLACVWAHWSTAGQHSRSSFDVEFDVVVFLGITLRFFYRNIICVCVVCVFVCMRICVVPRGISKCLIDSFQCLRWSKMELVCNICSWEYARVVAQL